MTPDLSIIIPYFNRADTIPFTLESVARARHGLQIETILVDDGSTPDATEQMRGQAHQPDRIIRQDNQGLLFARLTGLQAATGEFTLFLDSDDLVGPQKFVEQLAVMRRTGATVSYTDTTSAELGAGNTGTTLSPSVEVAEDTVDAATFFIRVQPAPHSPIFQTEWLRRLVKTPLFPPSALYNPVAEIWFYHLAAAGAATVVKVPGAHTIIGRHGGPRLTNQWEKMGVASLAVMEAFDRSCPHTAETRRARQMLGEKAFNSWRALPYDFAADFDHRLLALWQRDRSDDLSRLGGSRFRGLARLIGPVRSAKLLRRLTGHSYASCRTLTDPALMEKWMAQLPSA